uniref:Uncharacterized protein n=1 Tax=Cacopsylla melanoneura TaxID=428564 RepID=A0A8D8T127_9HEMI
MSHKNKQWRQKFRTEWLKDKLFENWLVSKKDHSGELVAFCKYCVCALSSNKYGDLKAHGATKKHISASNTVAPSRQPSMSSIVQKATTLNKVKLAEAKASLFIAEHCSILAIDHLLHVSFPFFPYCNNN